MTYVAGFFWLLARTWCAAVTAAPKGRARPWARPRPPLRWPGSMKRACATRCRMRRNRCRAYGAGYSTPDVNCQHIIGLALVEGTVSFEDSHSYQRMSDAKVLAAKERVQLIPDRALMDPAAPRSGRVEVTLRDGRAVSHFTRHPPGTKENPLNTERVNEKARSLMTLVLGAERTEEVIRRVNALETLNDVRELRPLLAANSSERHTS